MQKREPANSGKAKDVFATDGPAPGVATREQLDRIAALAAQIDGILTAFFAEACREAPRRMEAV